MPLDVAEHVATPFANRAEPEDVTPLMDAALEDEQEPVPLDVEVEPPMRTWHVVVLAASTVDTPPTIASESADATTNALTLRVWLRNIMSSFVIALTDT